MVTVQVFKDTEPVALDITYLMEQELMVECLGNRYPVEVMYCEFRDLDETSVIEKEASIIDIHNIPVEARHDAMRIINQYLRDQDIIVNDEVEYIEQDDPEDVV